MNHAMHISHNGKVAFIDMEAANAMLPARPMEEKPLTEDERNALPWSPWGADNLLPQQMAADIESCAALTGILGIKSRLALCEGIVPAIIKSDEQGQRIIDKVLDEADAPEIWEFLDASDHYTQTAGFIKDMLGIANTACRFMYDKAKEKIVAFQRDDVSELRYEKKGKNKTVENVYYSSDWRLTYNADDKNLLKLPLIKSWAPWLHSKELAAANKLEQVMTWRYPAWGKHYYSTPLWYSAYKWVKVSQAVPDMKANMFDNAMRPSWVVTIYKEFWPLYFEQWGSITDPAEKEALKLQFYTQVEEKLMGKSNAGKTIYITGEMSEQFGKGIPYIEFKALENPNTDGQLLPDAAAANSEIAFAEMMNLALIGGNQSAGPYTKNEGGSNIREASLFQTVLTELERRVVKQFMNVPKYVNGWNTKYPGLQFIIPATALTTLDTGAGSKPIMTGGVQPKDGNNNNTNNNGTGNNNTAG